MKHERITRCDSRHQLLLLDGLDSHPSTCSLRQCSQNRKGVAFAAKAPPVIATRKTTPRSTLLLAFTPSRLTASTRHGSTLSETMAPTTRARTRAPPAATVTQADQSASPAQPAQSSGPQKNVKRAAKRTKGNEVNQAPPAPPSGVSLANRSFSVNGPIAELPHELLLSILEHMVDGSEGIGPWTGVLWLPCRCSPY